MSNMISVASGFQYSVNISYDLNNDEKLKNFIPTQAALELLEEILLSTYPTSTERARVLIGAYGKGKSHIVLTILSMLMQKEVNLFEKLLEKTKSDQRLSHAIDSYYSSDRRILPVIITGSSTSLTQSFLLALQRTLSQNDLLDIMPETNYKAALNAIERWKIEYPNTYMQIEALINKPVEKFVKALESYDPSAYLEFERIFPLLTAGSTFNPFLGFDVVELYELAVKGLKQRGYSGLYVIYDEFSKYLEANITEASSNDTKMLQDFAEKCNRSGDSQMHIMLISHKEIANYIDKLPKKKVDGWRGVSERFKHVHLNSSFAQTYEIIGSVIRKSDEWMTFTERHETEFEDLLKNYHKHVLFSDVGNEHMRPVIEACYPLHPVSVYILPRLSERVAQNERTLFTFLSGEGVATLNSFLQGHDDSKFELIAPDLIYDYFEPLFRKEAYEGNIHQIYLLATSLLSQLESNSLESKIIKTIALINILEQYERLKPTTDEIINIYRPSYDIENIKEAITALVERKFLVYRKKSNNYLQLKQSSGINIHERIHDMIESQRNRIEVIDALNSANLDSYIYPSQYNDEHEMTRYFAFQFITSSGLSNIVHLDEYINSLEADGVIFAIIPNEEDSLEAINDFITKRSRECIQAIFVLPKKFSVIDSAVRELNAVISLRDDAAGDKVLFDEYEIIYEDLIEVVNRYIASYTHPEFDACVYIHNGAQLSILRKAGLTRLASNICEVVYPLAPVICNEVINRNDPTSIAVNSRTRIVSALLKTELEPNLGLSGTGQEVSIMRSTLLRTGILNQDNGVATLNFATADKNVANMLSVIETFILEARHFEKLSFDILYARLTEASGKIGMRKGLVPIYLAAVLHNHKQSVVISDRNGQVTLNSDAINLINIKPECFFVSHIDWDSEKEQAVCCLEKLFGDYVIHAEKNISAYDFIANAMRRWYMGLPRYAKECKYDFDGNRIDKRYSAFLKDLRVPGSNYQLLFKKLPRAFAYEEFSIGLTENIEHAVNFYNSLLPNLELKLIEETKRILSPSGCDLARKSLTSVVSDWVESLDQKVFEQLFSDGTERILSLFQTATNDETMLIARTAKAVTGLRLEDWDSSTFDLYANALSGHKATAEAFRSSAYTEPEMQSTAADYQVTFVDGTGNATTRRFERVERSKRSQLLYNQVKSALAAMGQSITEQEKRQVLMEILKEYC